MIDDDKLWSEHAAKHGWVMPRAAWWKRLPLIRHFRAFEASLKVCRYNAMARNIGMVPTGYDEWVVYGIAKGKERPND